ncbi:hypothetical protein J0A67_04670 [Algoriphagus aestuariicola]|uniref:Uncharacterized protein n=1 Tax=Algoriphagus aestuariicola TaxID=1852016 RepID=A0ABS3BLG5_9BACT|nr:hypothetical protein [Algoriphagus aestuariicola]MBN7800141.1 hypothetical protein [Algoriphagus aestuariicola]
MRYQKLGNDAQKAEDPEETKALRKAQIRMLPNMILLAIGIAGNLIIIKMIMSGPQWDG